MFRIKWIMWTKAVVITGHRGLVIAIYMMMSSFTYIRCLVLLKKPSLHIRTSRSVVDVSRWRGADGCGGKPGRHCKGSSSTITDSRHTASGSTVGSRLTGQSRPKTGWGPPLADFHLPPLHRGTAALPSSTPSQGRGHRPPPRPGQQGLYLVGGWGEASEDAFTWD